MNHSELYKLWAPETSIWSNWAKPVLFAEMTTSRPETSAVNTAPDPAFLPAPGPFSGTADGAAAGPPPPPNLDWVPSADSGAAIILDVPGAEAVRLGAQLIQRVFRPVPLFNGVRGPDLYALVNVDGIMRALNEASATLMAASLPDTAPPVFLLDAERFAGASFATPGRFDNRWYVFPQDFPSANFLLAHNIRSVVLAQRRSATPQSDLAHVLLRWRESEIEVKACGVEEVSLPVAATIPRPDSFRALWYRALVLAGLRRNSAGGFGAVIPVPSSSGGYG